MKYKVLKPFFDKYDGTLYQEGEVIDVTKARADEILDIDNFIKKVPTPTKKKTPSKKGE